MQAAALKTGKRRAHDQPGTIGHVAKLQQRPADPEIGIIVANFRAEHVRAVLGPFQALGGPHDTDVIPHELSHLVPVVGQHHLFVGIAHPAFIPGRDIQGLGNGRETFGNVARGGPGENQALQKRVGGKPVGAMQPGKGTFADPVESVEVGAPPEIGHDTAAGVMGGGHHGHGRARHVVAVFKTTCVEGGKMLLDETRPAMGDVELHIGDAEAFHFVIDGARHHVARGKLGLRIESVHEARPIGQHETAAFATHRLADQEHGS